MKYFQYAHYDWHHVERNFLISAENFLEYLHVKRNFLRNDLEISQSTEIELTMTSISIGSGAIFQKIFTFQKIKVKYAS